MWIQMHASRLWFWVKLSSHIQSSVVLRRGGCENVCPHTAWLSFFARWVHTCGVDQFRSIVNTKVRVNVVVLEESLTATLRFCFSMGTKIRTKVAFLDETPSLLYLQMFSLRAAMDAKRPMAVVWSKRLTKYLTTGRFYSTMGAKMTVKFALPGEMLAILCTFIGFLSGMDTKMYITKAACGETLTTYYTAERFCSAMSSNVAVKSVLHGETFITYCTFIWFLSGFFKQSYF